MYINIRNILIYILKVKKLFYIMKIGFSCYFVSLKNLNILSSEGSK